MKNWKDFLKTLSCICFSYFVSCNNKPSFQKTVKSQDTTSTKAIVASQDIFLPKSKVDRSKYHTNKDSIYIYSSSGDTLKYSKKDFNDIVDNFPKLNEGSPDDPDKTFFKSSVWVDLKDSAGNDKRISFSSEVGQDEYYILYAYFLKHKNGIAKYSARRKKLIEIYETLNSLFGNLNNGGTYFGHQYSRIQGYAEFSIYWFSHYEDYFEREYDVTRQRWFYINGLKQLIADETESDGEYNKQQRAERINRLNNKVNKLNKLITDNFYLRMAQSFQLDHY